MSIANVAVVFTAFFFFLRTPVFIILNDGGRWNNESIVLCIKKHSVVVLFLVFISVVNTFLNLFLRLFTGAMHRHCMLHF